MGIARGAVILCPPVAEWPTLDQAAWAAATCGDDLLGDEGGLACVAPATRRNVQRSYGRWLTFLREYGLLWPWERPSGRIKPELVSAFVDDLHKRNASTTIAQRVLELHMAAVAFDAAADWSWLSRTVRRLANSAIPVRDKRRQLVLSDELHALGITLMNELPYSRVERGKRRALHFRDGLVLALLAARPLRVGNFAVMELGRHLKRGRDRWTLTFDAAETKGRRVIDMPVPDGLTSYLERYLETWRPVLLGSETSDALWLTASGRRARDRDIYEVVRRQTAAHLGIAISPHRFRDALATYVAIHDPKHVGIVASLLGHRTRRSAERHYNLARDLEADLRWQATLRRRRRAVRNRGNF